MPADIKSISDDSKAALVCDDNKERQDDAADALETLAYKAEIAVSADDVFEKVKHNHYDLIYLHANFGGGSSENNEVLDFIQAMPMSARRKIVVVLSADKYTTLDNMAAFSESVDVVVNDADMRELKAALKKSITSHFMFYKAYNETLRAAGKA